MPRLPVVQLGVALSPAPGPESLSPGLVLRRDECRDDDVAAHHHDTFPRQAALSRAARVLLRPISPAERRRPNQGSLAARCARSARRIMSASWRRMVFGVVVVMSPTVSRLSERRQVFLFRDSVQRAGAPESQSFGILLRDRTRKRRPYLSVEAALSSGRISQASRRNRNRPSLQRLRRHRHPLCRTWRRTPEPSASPWLHTR